MKLADLRIPDGWTLEALPRDDDHALITTAPPSRYMVTMDFKQRGFRTGYSITGLLVGEAWNRRRKAYGGQRWKQTLIDDAVAHLKEIPA